MADARPRMGYIGIGLMGLPMTRRLLSTGYEVTVWNRTRKAIEPALEAGAKEGASPAEVAAASDIVLMCVLDTGAVEQVVQGPGGVIEGGAPGKVLVDHSTIVAERSRQMAKELRERTGMGWVDAPVSGGPPAAADGKLVVMAGGLDEDIERVRPVMADLSQRFTHMGPPGAGQATKMINQTVVGCTFAVLAEAVRLAENAGIDAARIPECLAGGYADGRMMQHFFPRMIARNFEPAGFARQMLKDLDMVQDLAKSTLTAMPMVSQADLLYRLLVSRGHGGVDTIGILKLYDKDPV
jgi:3-hydroxyisobutyrate dehydrogenase